MVNALVLNALEQTEKMDDCRFVLLKILQQYNLKPPSDLAILVYTDRPVLFEAYTSYFPLLQMKEVSRNEVQEWKGPNNVSALVRLRIIREVLENLKGNVLYCGPGVYFTQPPGPLFQELEKGNLLLLKQTKLNTQRKEELKKFLAPEDASHVEAATNNTIWDPRIIGMNHRNLDLVGEVLEATTSLPAASERIAAPYLLSTCFREAGNILPAAPLVNDYSNLKEFRWLLHRFFKKNEEESIPNLVKLVHHLDADAIRQHKNAFEALPLYKKILHSLTGKKWSIKRYENKF